jgi:hypothetical protein
MEDEADLEAMRVVMEVNVVVQLSGASKLSESLALWPEASSRQEKGHRDDLKASIVRQRLCLRIRRILNALKLQLFQVFK